MRKRLAVAVVLGLAAGAVLGSSCGARSELPLPETMGEHDASEPDAPPDVPDASVDAPPDVPDAPDDGGLPPCVEEALYVYLVTSETDLYRFDPAKLTFDLVGNLGCSGAASPFSMGVDRQGDAYVIYNDGKLYRVSTTDASCEATGWLPGGGQAFWAFGMGFAIDDDQQGETLYVAEINFSDVSQGLGSIDTDTFDLHFINSFSQNPGNELELTSAPDGSLYGYFIDAVGDGGTLVRIDKATAEILEATPLPVGQQSSALAFAQWGGAFYIFTTGGPQLTLITRYDPATGAVDQVGTLNKTVVGAGVSTCALTQ